jgi:hypothetical protein
LVLDRAQPYLVLFIQMIRICLGMHLGLGH